MNLNAKIGIARFLKNSLGMQISPSDIETLKVRKVDRKEIEIFITLGTPIYRSCYLYWDVAKQQQHIKVIKIKVFYKSIFVHFVVIERRVIHYNLHISFSQ
ncbi:MAG: hypothetical protein Q6363_010060 [Candidatus Njordarchaeota archaeon]